MSTAGGTGARERARARTARRPAYPAGGTFGRSTVDVRRGGLGEALTAARDALECDFFDWLGVVDLGGTGFRGGGARLVDARTGTGCWCAPGSRPTRRRCRASSPVYPGAAWHEREAHEMFGVDFPGHPGLAPLLLAPEFEGHPLRKDFVLASRVVKPWPGAVEPGESGRRRPSPRRRARAPPASAPARRTRARRVGAAMTAAAAARSRGVIALLEENCTSCMLCARECPDWCIYIDSHKEEVEVPGGRGRDSATCSTGSPSTSRSACTAASASRSARSTRSTGRRSTSTPRATSATCCTSGRRCGEWIGTVPVPPAHDPNGEPSKTGDCSGEEILADGRRRRAGLVHGSGVLGRVVPDEVGRPPLDRRVQAAQVLAEQPEAEQLDARRGTARRRAPRPSPARCARARTRPPRRRACSRQKKKLTAPSQVAMPQRRGGEVGDAVGGEPDHLAQRVLGPPGGARLPHVATSPLGKPIHGISSR